MQLFSDVAGINAWNTLFSGAHVHRMLGQSGETSLSENRSRGQRMNGKDLTRV